MAVVGIETYIQNFGGEDHRNTLRGADFSQPDALMREEILRNGWRVRFTFKYAYGIEANFSHRTKNFKRIIPARIPLELLAGNSGKLPNELEVGDVLETGCVVLDTPAAARPSSERNFQDDTEILLTGGRFGHKVQVPSDIEVAVYGHLNKLTDGDKESLFGKFIIDRLMDMKPSTRRNLATSKL